MKLRAPIYTKVLGWFFVNLLLVVALVFAFVAVQSRLGGLEWLVTGESTQRIEAVAELVTDELRERSPDDWPEVLARYSQAHGVTFLLFRNDARQIAGPDVNVPDNLEAALRDRRGPPSERRREPPGEQAPDQGPPRAKLHFMVRTGGPVRYWVGVHLGLNDQDPRDRRPTTLVAMSDNLTGDGFFLDLKPWIGLVLGALLLSALVWLPMVAGITRAIRRLNDAAKVIAEGRFDVRLSEDRRDELGDLAGSVNAMAAKLGSHVAQVRRVTADVAHELCSPIARLQMAMGIVQQRGTPAQATYLEKMDAELQHMARLVEDVLAFAKTGRAMSAGKIESVSLRSIIDEAIAREAPDVEVRVAVAPEMKVLAIRDSLDRAVSNVLRNAVRYAASSGPIEIAAVREADMVLLTVRDQGPGVPPESLPRLFDAFYRPEAARGRNTGGSGLGLAIVKASIEACGGKVGARLLKPAGLEISMSLPSAT